MSTTFELGLKALFPPNKHDATKNGCRISLISHVVASAYTLGTPQKPLCLRRCDRHDA